MRVALLVCCLVLAGCASAPQPANCSSFATLTLTTPQGPHVPLGGAISIVALIANCAAASLTLDRLAGRARVCNSGFIVASVNRANDSWDLRTAGAALGPERFAQCTTTPPGSMSTTLRAGGGLNMTFSWNGTVEKDGSLTQAPGGDYVVAVAARVSGRAIVDVEERAAQSLFAHRGTN